MENSPGGDKKNIVKLAHLYFQAGQWDKALGEYRKILALDPDDMNTHNTLGDIYLKKNSYEAAYESYNKAAMGFLNRDQVDKALSVYKKIIKLDLNKLSQDARTKISFVQSYVKADEMLKGDQIEGAIEVFGKILKFRAQDQVVTAKLIELDKKIAEMSATVEQYQNLGDIFLKNDIFDRAQAMFKKMAELEPDSAILSSNLAQLYVKQGSENEAKKEYLSIAEQAFIKGDLDSALNWALKAIELKSVEAHYISGLVFFNRQKWTEAKTEFEKLLRIKVNHLGALLHLARIFDILDQVDKATEIFHKVLKIDKDDPQVQEAWLEFCVRRKDKETAISNLSVLLNKAVAENDTQRVVKLARMMIALDSDLVFQHIQLVNALITQGDSHYAADACCALALVYEKQGHFIEAAGYLEKALVLSPENAEVLEAALANMRHKAFPPAKPALPPRGPILTLVEEVKSDEDAVMEPVSHEPIEHSPPIKMYSNEARVSPLQDHGSVSAYSTELAMAELCVNQSLYKAAIEIYEHILNINPGLTEVQNKLNHVTKIYLRTQMEPKIKDMRD